PDSMQADGRVDLGAAVAVAATTQARRLEFPGDTRQREICGAGAPYVYQVDQSRRQAVQLVGPRSLGVQVSRCGSRVRHVVASPLRPGIRVMTLVALLPRAVCQYKEWSATVVRTAPGHVGLVVLLR